jgi:hypothetical protein
VRDAGISAAAFHLSLSVRERISSFPAVLSLSERLRWAMPPVRTIVVAPRKDFLFPGGPFAERKATMTCYSRNA